MSGAEIESIIGKLAETLGTSAQHLVEIYVPWVVASAWMFIGIGAITIIAGIIIGIFLIYAADSGDDRAWAGIIMAIIIFIGSLFVGCNIPDVVAPKAAAIQKILYDVKTGK